MTDLAKLKALAEAAIEQSDNIGEAAWYTADCLQHLLHAGAPDAEFIAAANPTVVLELIAENERLRADYAALSTFNPDWDRAVAAQDSVREHMELANQLKAECEALRQEIEHSKTNPLYSTRSNSRRYVWLRDNHIGDDPGSINLECGPRSGLNSAIDAAMGKEASNG